MGLDYSFEIIAPRDSVMRFVEALSAHLISDDADRLLAAARKDPERLMSAVSWRDNFGGSDLCLSFLFEPDEHITEYGSIEGCVDPVTGQVAVGCVWSSLRCGHHYILYRGTAASSLISLLFARSQTIREVFISVSRESEALVVLFDDEQGELIGVWPPFGPLGFCIEHDFLPDHESHPYVDEYCEATLDALDISNRSGHV